MPLLLAPNLLAGKASGCGEEGSTGTGAREPGPAAGSASGGAADDVLNVCGLIDGTAGVADPKAIDAATLFDLLSGVAGAATLAGTELVGGSFIYPFAPWASAAEGIHVDTAEGTSGFSPHSHVTTAAACGPVAT